MATIIPGIFLSPVSPCVRGTGSQHKGLQVFALHRAHYCQDFRSIRLCCSCNRLWELTVSAHEYRKGESRFLKRCPFLVLLLSFQLHITNLWMVNRYRYLVNNTTNISNDVY